MNILGVDPKIENSQIQIIGQQNNELHKTNEKTEEETGQVPEDCTSCRVIGTVTPLVGLAYCAWFYPSYKDRYTGAKKVLLRAYFVLLPIGRYKLLST